MVAVGLWGSFCWVLVLDTLRLGVSRDVLVMEQRGQENNSERLDLIHTLAPARWG